MGWQGCWKPSGFTGMVENGAEILPEINLQHLPKTALAGCWLRRGLSVWPVGRLQEHASAHVTGRNASLSSQRSIIFILPQLTGMSDSFVVPVGPM